MDVIMPQLGETVAEGIVTRWYKKVGDTVKADEALFDVETDKVSTEIPAPTGGVVAEILIAEGVTVKVGARLAVIREGGPAQTAPTREAAVVAVAAPPTAGAPASLSAPVFPSVSAPLSTASSTSLSSTGAAASRPRAPAGERLSPVVRRLIAEHSLDAHSLRGTGRDGRITREDVLGHIASGGQSTAPARGRAPAPAARAPAMPPADAGASSVPHNSVRRRVAENMAKSWTTTPHVLQVVEADFLRIDQVRRESGAEWKAREGYSLTYLPFIARAVSIALAKFPRLNATYQDDKLVLHRRINLGFAVDLNFEGLMVPVVKDVPNKSLPQIAREINDLAQRARAGKLKPDELAEGTYTISNNGSFGTLITASIIYPGQTAILSTDAIRKKPVVVEGPDGDSIAIRPVGMLAQTFDHRAVDGAYSAAFLREVKTIIETRNWAQALSA